MGKEALPTLCPWGFWYRVNLVNLVPRLDEFRFSFVDSWVWHERLFRGDCVTLWSDPNPFSQVLKPSESRVPLDRSFWVLEKTPILVGISSIPPKPWSDSLIPYVDMFTSPLWSSLQNLSSFGLDLILQSSKFPKVAGWKMFLDSIFLITGWTDALKLYASDQQVSRFFMG